MYCVIYEFKVKPGKEEVFRAAWKEGTRDLTKELHSLGARLHRSEEGTLIAYAQWSDEAAWQKGHNHIEAHAAKLADECLEETPTIIRKMIMLDDLLVNGKQDR